MFRFERNDKSASFNIVPVINRVGFLETASFHFSLSHTKLNFSLTNKMSFDTNTIFTGKGDRVQGLTDNPVEGGASHRCEGGLDSLCKGRRGWIHITEVEYTVVATYARNGAQGYNP